MACLQFGWSKQGITPDTFLTARDDDGPMIRERKNSGKSCEIFCRASSLFRRSPAASSRWRPRKNRDGARGE